MLGTDDVDEELQRGFGLSINELEPLLKAGGDAAEMKFMECCRYLWQADGAELTEPFIEALFEAYELVRAHRKIDAYIDIALTQIYGVMTLLPGTDYTLLDFTRDLYFLDTSGTNETRKGFKMSLTASTVSRERSVKVLRFVGRDGYEKEFAAIKFTPPGGGE